MTQAIDLANAINNFVVGCKQDGIWDPIKACCIMAAWDGLNGALYPLKGTAPTNYNFVSGDYNRETGLAGDKSTKYLDSNRANNADPQNSKHVSVYSTNITDSNVIELLMSSSITGVTTGVTMIVANGTNDSIVGRANSTQSSSTSAIYGQSFLVAVNRSSSSAIELLVNQTLTASASTSQTPNNANINIYGYGGGSSNARLAFYSIGESLDLAALDTRVSALITAIGAAIP